MLNAERLTSNAEIALSVLLLAFSVFRAVYGTKVTSTYVPRLLIF